MGTNQVTFVLGQGGLGRPLPGTDHYSGFVFGLSTLAAAKTFTCNSPQDAVDNGINGLFTDETKATASIQITNMGAVGDVITISIQEPNQLVQVVQYTKQATDTTIPILATSIQKAIVDAFYTNGYNATVTTDTVTIQARKGLGTYLNAGAKMTVAITGTIAKTVTDFSGGVASLVAPIYYHITEFFRIQPQGKLFCLGVPVLNAAGTDILTVQEYALGECKQILYFDPLTTYTTAKITALQAVANSLLALKNPAVIIAAYNQMGVTLASLTNLNSLSAPQVSVCIAQDAGGAGNELAKGNAKSITAGGAMLGAEALSFVQEDIAYVAKFNMSNGTELEVLGFANGDTYAATSKATINSLNDYRYVFLLQQRRITGSYWNDSHMACIKSSDYAYIESNRTIFKAIRNVDYALTPHLNGNVDINADGTITDISIEVFTSDINEQLEEMKKAGEISAYSTTIDPTQDILSTSELDIVIDLVPKGVARNIKVKIGYTLKIA